MFPKEGAECAKTPKQEIPRSTNIARLLQLERQAGVTISYLHLTQEKSNL